MQILPREVRLSTVEAQQRLVIVELRGELTLGQVARKLEWSSDDPKVVKVENDVAIPLANGKATLTVKAGERTATVPVFVTGQDQPFAWSFRNHVESVFSKSGCNGGACHGALKGKNGFRLKLFGYDPDADFIAITRDDRGRRITLADPGRSMVLTKPTGLLPHKGGVRFEVDSLEYRVLSEWIAAGTPGPSDADPRPTKLEILPSHSVQKVGATQQILVLCHFSDGHVEDVTRWVKFRSTNEAVATIDPAGVAKIVGPGEGGFHAWYLNHNVIARASVPFDQQVDPAIFAAADGESRNFIDKLVNRKLRDLNLPPSPLCDDATFLRRAYLDTLGILPTADETRAFLADANPQKRDRVIDDLLARPEFVDYWSYRWSDLLLVSGQRLRPEAIKSYYGWIRRNVVANTPWDRMVRELVTASGSTLENGAANFYALHQDPTEMAETTAMAFLGLSINCAKCHNHPLEKWTNDQYFAFANLFGRVQGKGWGGDFRNGDGNRVIFAAAAGDLVQPSRGRPQPPAPLDGRPLALDDPQDRRGPLADWLVAPENPYFTRAIVNRIWANYLGVGLVEKVDDVRDTNPASNEELLTALSQHLIREKYDLKQLMSAILRSATYQRASEPRPENRADTRFYSHYYPKRLKAEVLLDAASAVTAAPTAFKDIPPGTRAIQLADADVASYFLATFGRPERLITCECERSDEPSMVQVLHIYNGDTLNQKLQADKNRIATRLAENASPEAIVEELYLVALGRMPNAAEKTKLAKEIADAMGDERRAVVEDIYWSVLGSKEFLFNH